MGLKSWFRRERDHVIATQVEGAIKDAIEDAAAGKDGPMAESIVNGFLNHKAQWGSAFMFLGGLFAKLAMTHPGHWFDMAAEVFIYTGGYCLAGGVVKSDADRKKEGK